MKKEWKDLRASVGESVHATMASELQITGIRPTSGENLRSVLCVSAKKLSTSLVDTNVKNVRKSLGKSKDGVIRVTFSSKEIRYYFEVNGRRAKLKGEIIGIVGVKKSFVL